MHSLKIYKIQLKEVEHVCLKTLMKNLIPLWIHYSKRILLIEQDRNILNLHKTLLIIMSHSNYILQLNYQIQNILLKSWEKLWSLTSLSH